MSLPHEENRIEALGADPDFPTTDAEPETGDVGPEGQDEAEDEAEDER